MATIVASASGGTRAWTATASWVGGVVPTAADDVQINGTSGSITIDAGAVCRSLDCTGYTGTITHQAAATLNIGDGTAGLGNVALLLVSGMTYTKNGSSPTLFKSTSATQQTIATGGKSLGDTTINGVGSSYQLTSAMTSAGLVTLTAGTFDTNGQTCSWSTFSASSSTARTLTMGASAITLTSVFGGTIWQLSSTNLTISTNTATITMTGAGTFSATSSGSIDYNGASLVFTAAGAVVLTHGSGSTTATFANITRTGTAIPTDSFEISTSTSGSLTCTGTFTCNGNSAINRMLVKSRTLATSCKITAATVVVSNSDFMDVTGAGAGSWNLASITGNSGDCGGNSGITFTTSATQTWSGTSGGNWSANAWTTRVPLPQDDVVIASAFSASQTIQSNIPRLGRNIDFTGATGTPTWALGSQVTTIYGSVTLITGMTLTQTTGLHFAGRGSYSITSAGRTFTPPIFINAPTGTYTLADAFITTSNMSMLAGTFTTANNTMTVPGILTNGASLAHTLNLGSSTINITNTAGGTPVNFTSAFLTMNAGTSEFVFGSATNSRTFSGGSKTYGTLTYTVAGSTGALIINGSNTFTAINFSDVTNARTLTFTSSTTSTVTTFNVNGTLGKLMTINSDSSGTHATLSKASGTVTCDYVSIKDNRPTGGATFNATNATNVSNTTGWNFLAGNSHGFFKMF